MAGTAHEKHGHRRFVHDFFGVATHENPGYAAPAVRSHDDHVGLRRPGLFEDRMRDHLPAAVDQERRHLYARAPSGGLRSREDRLAASRIVAYSLSKYFAG